MYWYYLVSTQLGDEVGVLSEGGLRTFYIYILVLHMQLQQKLSGLFQLLFLSQNKEKYFIFPRFSFHLFIFQHKT